MGGILPGVGCIDDLDGLDGAVERQAGPNQFFQNRAFTEERSSNSRALAFTAKGAICGLAAPQAPGSFAILRAPLGARRVLNHQSLLSVDQGL